MKVFQRRPSLAHVLAAVALFVALGGGAYAVSSVGKNEVKSKQIKDGAVKSRDIGNDAVNSSDLGAVTVQTNTVLVPGGGQMSENGDGIGRTISVNCATGEQLLGGGAGWTDVGGTGDDDEFFVVDSRPNDAGTGWVARGFSDFDADRTFEVRALCLAP